MSVRAERILTLRNVQVIERVDALTDLRVVDFDARMAVLSIATTIGGEFVAVVCKLLLVLALDREWAVTWVSR